MKIQKETKEAAAVISAMAMLTFGAALALVGFIVEPLGQIHDSVLYVLGQCLIYAGSIFGIGIYAKKRIDEMEIDLRRRHHREYSTDPSEEDDEL